MGVTLYTSRIVLRELGVSDYGIYSVIGGFIALFGVFDSSMSAATQRYLSYDIGKGNIEQLKKTFSCSLTIIIGIAFLVLLLAETVGLWYVNYKMIYPPERSFAVKIVYQISIFTALVGIIQVPYNALIIAREDMSVYAYISFAEVSLKLIIVFLLVYFGSDKLITYSILYFCVTVIVRLYYQYYCRKNYKESIFTFVKDRNYYNELIGYSGWNLFGNVAYVARGQGGNMVLNLFFGTIANAAYGITLQIQGAVSLFINNFQLAANPQIIKLYAQQDSAKMQHLINQVSKFSFYLSFLLVAPFFFNINLILELWLVHPPRYSALLSRISLLCVLIDSISGPLMTGIQATGKIKAYQMVVGCLVFLNLPISYLLFKLDVFQSPEVVFYVWLSISFLALAFRLYFLRKTQGFQLAIFVKRVLFRILTITFIGALLGYYINKYILANSLFSFALQTLLYCGCLIVIIFFAGIEREERTLILNLKDKLINRRVR